MATIFDREQTDRTRPSGAGSASKGRSRLLYIDNLRVLLTVLVILHHLAIGYGAEGDWMYEESGPAGVVSRVLMTLFAAVNQSFFMGMFFLVSSYLLPGSYDRKGPVMYVLDRLKRLGIPWAFYQLLVHPFLDYTLMRPRHFPQSFLGMLPMYWRRLRTHSYADSPMWFLEMLLVFSFAYVLWRLLTRRWHALPPATQRALGDGAIALFALALGLAAFVVRLEWPIGRWYEPLHWQVAHLAQYVALFAAGIVAYRRGWFEGLTAAQGRLWLGVALLLVPVLPAVAIADGALTRGLSPFFGGMRWQGLFFALWDQLMGVAMTVTLLVLFRDHLNHQGKWARAMSAAAYGAYIFHTPVIVWLATGLRTVRIDMGLKFLCVAPLAVALTFLVAHLVKKLPVVRSIL